MSALAVGSIKVLPEAEACLLRDRDGVYAISLVCTHEGCDIAIEGSVDQSGVLCRCHGSRFDLNGRVLVGPATEDLGHYLVSVDDAGNLTVHTATTVDPATRLTV